MAVKEMWARLFSVSSLAPEIDSATQQQWFIEDTALEMFEWKVELADGSTIPSRTWTVVHFRDGFIERERVYCDSNASHLVEQALDNEEFFNFPGVERIPSRHNLCDKTAPSPIGEEQRPFSTFKQSGSPTRSAYSYRTTPFAPGDG